MKSVIAFLAFTVFASPALAQDEPDCTDPTTQMDMTACAVIDYNKADTVLNEVWAEAIAEAKNFDILDTIDDGRPGYEETLRSAQRAWIAFRDASCNYEGYFARGGTMEPMLVNQCLARLTGERTKQLRQLIQDMGNQ